MADDSSFSDTAPILAQAARTQVAVMMARLGVRGFDGLTPAFAGLIPLLDAEGTRSTTLAERTGVTKQAMSQLVKLLEKRGYVEQAPDSSDTRAKVVRLTKRGMALRTACMEVRRELHAAAVKTLGRKDFAELQVNLKRLTESMAAILKP